MRVSMEYMYHCSSTYAMPYVTKVQILNRFVIGSRVTAMSLHENFETAELWLWA